MLKFSSPDFSKLAPLKTKVTDFIQAKGPLPFVITGVAVVSLITFLILLTIGPTTDKISDYPSDLQSPDNPNERPPLPPEDQPNKTPVFINLQPIVDTWLKTTRANVGLMVYDLDNDQVAASYQPDKVFDVASIYKLFFVYDGYRQIENGTMSADAHYTTTSDYRTGAYTYGECLDLMIRESYNGCADKMYSDRGASARVNDLISELNLTNTSNSGLSSTAADLTELLKLYYEHPDLSDENWQKITDSMLNQPATEVEPGTTYNWRQGLPSGFSKQVNVYDKVGWAWDVDNKAWTTYADAAIVDFAEQNRHYIIVVLTSGLPDRTAKTIANLGARIEDAILSHDNSL